MIKLVSLKGFGIISEYLAKSLKLMSHNMQTAKFSLGQWRGNVFGTSGAESIKYKFRIAPKFAIDQLL